MIIFAAALFGLFLLGQRYSLIGPGAFFSLAVFALAKWRFMDSLEALLFAQTVTALAAFLALSFLLSVSVIADFLSGSASRAEGGGKADSKSSKGG